MTKPETRRFFAVAKQTKDSRAQSYGFDSANPTTAIGQMLKAFNVFSTDQLYEYDLMEVVDAGHYRPVAQKYPPSERSSAGKAFDSTPTQTVMDLPASTDTGKPPWKEDATEQVYNPYNVAAA